MNNKNKTGPNFIGIGVERAATDWIYSCLSWHPEICISSKKEINFFNESYNYRKGITYYLSFFNHCPQKKIKGEFTPAYMVSPKSAYLIQKHFPNVKLIVSLRNPIERAYSSYKFHRQWKGPFGIYNSFEDAIKKNKAFIERGFYYKQLKRYFDLFPKENILVVFYEDIKSNQVHFIQAIYKFLELNNNEFIPPIINEKRNVIGYRIIKYKIPLVNYLIYKFIEITGGDIRRLQSNNWIEKLVDYFNMKKSIAKFLDLNKKKISGLNKEIFNFSPMKERTRKYLYNIYKTDIDKLENLLNKDLISWKLLR